MGLCDMNNTLEKVTVISGWLASVCRSREKRKKKKSERLKGEKKGSHTCMRPVLNDENSQTVTDTQRPVPCCAVSINIQFLFVSCYHCDAEPC